MRVLEEMLRNSEKIQSKERRDRIEILAEILFVARNGATKTEIVYKANLNFKRVKSYLDYLEGKGFLENSGPLYKSTEIGEDFLRNYQSMKKNLLT